MLLKIVLLSQSLILLSCSGSETTPGATATPTPTATATATANPGGSNTTTNLTWNTGASELFATHCAGCHSWATTLSGVQGKRTDALSRVQSTTNPMPEVSEQKPSWSTDKAKVINYLSSTTLQ
ncbi:MAG: hypothetical protein RI953_487 [Pseudomonadota bacterium]|jgi:hypothetical protein